ncbi:sodium/solute symporter [Nesterenkonia sp. PF2B19]|uniref:sodium/solute symporter n=1 Tax=Nesterenkonia sp. PF2B19 TaxID=1881858 RepID=UPI000A19C7B1|nr:cation acetate symporter [Nesterenkonia sp. PF2B19]OSM43531.1 cation acetate symporter [Nesterenkonia sp. PF2B19]
MSSPSAVLLAVALVCVFSVAISVGGLRSRTTSDFYVASRRVPPWMNASAIAGDYLSAASFLGVAGLIVAYGAQGLWFPVGYTAGFFTLLLFVAAPLRRSGAYTLPDFATLRFRSAQLRRLTALIVIMTGWLYVVPQLHGASLTLSTTAGMPGWVGPLVVVLVVLPTVLAGGMRSVTVAQAVQYWMKLCALLIPCVFILIRLQRDASTGGSPLTDALPPLGDVWETGLLPQALDGGAGLYQTASLALALMMGTVGLPHVLVRFSTNPDGAAARRTTLLLLSLLSMFYLLPVILGVLARLVLPVAEGGLGPAADDGGAATPAPSGGTAADVGGGAADAALLRLPAAVFEGAAGDVLVAVVAGGAFAAFLSTCSGLVVSIAGVVSQEFFSGTVRGFRLGAVAAVGLPLLVGAVTSQVALAGAVAMVFTFTASALGPLILLGIWWRGLTEAGAIAGMVSGAVVSSLSLVIGLGLGEHTAGAQVFLYPALWCIPLSFLLTVAVSRFGRQSPPHSAEAVLARLHLPEAAQALSR